MLSAPVFACLNAGLCDKDATAKRFERLDHKVYRDEWSVRHPTQPLATFSLWNNTRKLP